MRKHGIDRVNRSHLHHLNIDNCHSPSFDTLQIKMATWNLLPAEIRLMILEIIVQEPGSTHATVSYEWLHVFEKRNFAHLSVSQFCLRDLDRIVHRQRAFVRHIWLSIEQREYPCAACWAPPNGNKVSKWWGYDLSRGEHDRIILRRVIWRAFDILSTWEPNENQGLILELSAYSPTDTHCFPRRYFGNNAYARDLGSCSISCSKPLITLPM